MSRRDGWFVGGFALVILGVPTFVVVWVAGQYGMGPFAKSADEASYNDLERLDAYAAELGIVMGRTYGSADNHAARVDGPGSDLEVLVARGDSFADGAEVVLRLTMSHEPDSFFSSSGTVDGDTVSVCYRWVYGTSTHDYEPERLDDCPPGPALTVTPTPLPPTGD